jgi:hypothetical protein
MGDAARAEADALMRAISELLPLRNGAAVDAIPPLRAALAVLIVADDHAPTKATTVSASSSIRAKTTPLRPAKRVKRAFQAGAMRVHREAPRPPHNGLPIGVRRVDPSWPGIRDRVQAAMTKRDIGPTALARVVGIPPGTLRKYLADTVPPPDVRALLVAWVDQAARAALEASKPPRTPRVAPPPPAREGTATPGVPFLGSGTPFRIGATETAARA